MQIVCVCVCVFSFKAKDAYGALQTSLFIVVVIGFCFFHFGKCVLCFSFTTRLFVCSCGERTIV